MLPFACVVLTLLAADPKPNTLTPEEARDGWLLLFDGETTFGWRIKGEAKVEKGALVLGSKTEPTTAILPGAFRDFELRFDSEGKGRFTLDWEAGKSSPGWVEPRMVLHVKVIGAGTGGSAVSRSSGPVGGVQRLETEITYDPRYRPVCRFDVPAGQQMKLTNIKLQPLNLPSIFNGKDLAGWKEHPGRKSKFTVTKEGWLNVKDGNGDLQTEEQWADFVLQLECISNGKHLNSGIFFRCRPNEYQNGYEAQIRNQFTEQPTQKYLIEEYDPKTHELIGKKEVLSPAVDYGTGAIYRRQPARRGVAKDGEWFTLTVVAHGRHFATWVNGIQVTDWTDHRKPNDNARNGFRAEKGPISIQGHDPTTDLSFRNLRIVELPPAKP